MTTPAQNITKSAITSNHYVVRNKNTGVVTNQGSVTSTLHVVKKVRPVSKSNKPRSDGTRAPSAWSHRWSHAWGLNGMFIDNSGTSSVITTRGPLLVNNSLWEPSTAMVDPLMRNARLAALAKGTESAMQSNAALYQARDLVKMSRNYLDRANEFFTRPDSKSWDQTMRRWKQSAKNVPDDYLAYLYGVAPLGDDIANCLDRITSYRTKGYRMSLILKASKKHRGTIYRSAAVRHGTGTRSIRFPCRVTTGCRVGYRFDLPSWFMDRAPTVAPFSTAHELTRFSFVLDWFLPVGNYLGALESAQFSPFFREGYETSYVQEAAVFSQAECTNGVAPHIDLSGHSVNGTMQRKYISEYPSSVMTRPALNPLPGIDKVAQGLSLLTQTFKRWR